MVNKHLFYRSKLHSNIFDISECSNFSHLDVAILKEETGLLNLMVNILPTANSKVMEAIEKS